MQWTTDKKESPPAWSQESYWSWYIRPPAGVPLYGGMGAVPVPDLGGAPGAPPSYQIFLDVMQFWGTFIKIVFWGPPWGLAPLTKIMDPPLCMVPHCIVVWAEPCMVLHCMVSHWMLGMEPLYGVPLNGGCHCIPCTGTFLPLSTDTCENITYPHPSECRL